jgi:hypothetical protein
MPRHQSPSALLTSHLRADMLFTGSGESFDV